MRSPLLSSPEKLNNPNFLSLPSLLHPSAHPGASSGLARTAPGPSRAGAALRVGDRAVPGHQGRPALVSGEFREFFGN